ncbi:8702_t:CDS:2 [Ambispora leptoticha]|uniref:8702_t:CDS:1 n=1 Tax=Ambispora leptoticha TaxID=144679 RepID=A0A9N8ZA87_9GLOM|nr:8702_t:CDS:2 [Ambispora leptoticha]
MVKGDLHVRVLEGRNVKDTDAIGQGDPFVEFWIDGHEKHKTEARNNTSTPVWLYETIFPLSGSEHHLHVRLLDKDLLSNDEIGETEVDLKPVYQSYYQDTWIQVSQPGSKEATGEIHLILEYFPKH